MENINNNIQLEVYRQFEKVESNEGLYLLRLKIDDAMKILKDIKKNLDKELIQRMQDENVKKIEVILGEKKTVVSYGNKKIEKVINPDVIKNYLMSGNETEKALAYRALSGGQSAWSVAKVREMADTLGMTLVSCTYESELVIKETPIDALISMGKIKKEIAE
jgi:hypothetical protein